jgi:hypothetical protein
MHKVMCASQVLQVQNSARTSPSMEVRIVANIAAADVKNLKNLEKKGGMSLTMNNMWEMRRVLLDMRTPVPSWDASESSALRSNDCLP